MSTQIEEEETHRTPQGLDPMGVLLFLIVPICIAVALGGGLSAKNAPVMTAITSSNGNVAGVAPQNQKYVTEARQDAVRVGISPDLFQRQIMQESGFNPNAYSSAKAIGIAQWLATTAAAHGVNPYDPDASLLAAATWMAQLSHQYGSYDAALAAYNAGPGAVDTAMNSCHSAWESCLPGETQNYIHVIDPNN